jgi:hypothetical protein
MPTIGQDCHITLNHPDVNGGQAYGFLVNENGGTRPGGVEITHEVDTYGTTRLWLYFDILLADFAVNPDGSIHQATRSQDYTMLLQYLSQLDSIMLATPIGTFLNLGAVGWTADERHMPGYSLMKCQINNIGVYWPPIAEDILAACIWGSDDIGARTWATSYWR